MARKNTGFAGSAWSYMTKSTHTSNADEEKGETLEDKLFGLDLNKKTVSIIIEHGQKYLNHPEAFGERFSLDVNVAKEALEVFKAFKIKQISKRQIQEFSMLVEKNPLKSLEEVALANGIDEFVVSAYLAYLETTLTESERVAIKKHLDAGSPLVKIAEDLKIS